MGCLAFMTDFGLRDGYVGQMHCVAAGIAPQVPRIDLSHGVAPQDVAAGAFTLAAAVPYLPDGCVACCVVDPGVGTPRRAVALRGRAGHRALGFVGPDNGLLPPALDLLDELIGAVEIADRSLLLPQRGTTFDGRDVFAPAAAHLAAGGELGRLGPAIDGASLVRLPARPPRRDRSGWTGRVVLVDGFGTLVSDLPAALLSEDGPWTVVVAAHEIGPVRAAFGEVGVGELVAIVGSSGTIEVAVRDGSAATRLGARAGAEVRLRARGDAQAAGA